MLDGLVEWAPAPMPRNTDTREVTRHGREIHRLRVLKFRPTWIRNTRDRVAFMRVVSGKYGKGMKAASGAYRQGRSDFRRADPLWRAIARTLKKRTPGDIIGLHNHGTIQIGDTFTQGEMMKFTGIPNFAPGTVPSYSPEGSAEAETAAEKGWFKLSEEGRGPGLPPDR
ncbi:peptide chain release factor 3 [Klebsiella pneumoniae]|uniref:Peptide chain release factor 3 n=1 Tax=Klebsiella pneumoniae TaxID=573 RepID=A0A378FXM2_KLEPN|nr:peptide chain release factor 3 [Klebsiella pneumoniae]